MARSSALIGVSLLVHASLAAAVSGIRQERRRESTAITLAEGKKKIDPPKPVDPPRALELPEPSKNPLPKAAPRRAPAPAPKSAPAEAPRAAAPSALEALPDFGLSLSGSVGAGGLAVPAGAPNAAPAAGSQAPPPQAARAAPKPAEDGCDEPLKKPRPVTLAQPSYTPQAIEARVEGKVRVELTLDEQGKVISARVLSGLGHGLDQRALEAARHGTFSPGTRCGKPTRATLVVGVRFSL